MTTDKTSTAIREPYDAMGPVDAPNPPAARATLATVKYGGCVQLPTSERERFEAWGRAEGLPLARGKLGGYAFEVTAKAWLAWQYLSAQPSPGGQGEAHIPLATPGKGEWSKGWNACRDAMLRGEGEALAARQPVGEPVEMSPEFTDTARAAIAWVLWHHQGGSSPVGQPLRFALGMGQHDRMTDNQIAEAKRFAAWAGATTEKFHHRAPAQAVDLGQLERLDMEGVPTSRGWDVIHNRDETGEWVRYDDVKAMIDSQAVGNG